MPNLTTLIQSVPLAQKASAWVDLKNELVKYDSWIDTFSEPFLIEVNKLIDAKPNARDPLRFEEHLSVAKILTTRLRTLRDEAYEYEIAGVRAAAEHRLKMVRSCIEREIAITRLAIPEHKIAKQGFEQASTEFAKDNLSGHASHMKTLSNQSQKAADKANDLEKLLNLLYDLEEEYESNFHARHLVSGNGHNYAERYHEVKQLFAETLEDLIERSFAIYFGVTNVLNLPIQKPPTDLENYGINPLILWIRRTARRIEECKQREIAFTCIVPLTQLFGQLRQSLISPSAFQTALATPGQSKTLRFDLKSVFPFAPQTPVRLHGIGLAFDIHSELMKKHDLDLDRIAYLRGQARIDLPHQVKLNLPHSKRPSVEFGNVAAFGRTIPIATETHGGILNADPRGVWAIHIDRALSYNGSAQYFNIDDPTNLPFFVDLKLLLRLIVVK